MFAPTNWYAFDAILRSQEGEDIARGEAHISMAQKAVTFESDFVPLYPIGTPMQIVRLHQEKEIHRFSGKVYLSDKKLMRIVAVKDELLPGSEYFYSDKMNFPAILSAFPVTEGKKRRFFKRPALPEISIPKEFAVQIVGLTEERLIFHFKDPASRLLSRKENGNWSFMGVAATELNLKEEFFITAGNPLNIQVPISVSKPFYFGEQASYLCEYRKNSPELRRTIANFLWQYNLEHNKLF